MLGFSQINFPGALPASRSSLARPSWGLERNGAPPPHLRVCRVCLSLPPPISLATEARAPAGAARRLRPPPPSPSVPLPGRSGLGGGSAGRGSRARRAGGLRWGLEGAERRAGWGGGCARGQGRECRRQAPRRHIAFGFHSAPKCPFPRPAAAERRVCGSGGAGGGTCSRRLSRGGGQTWRVWRVPELRRCVAAACGPGRHADLGENPVPTGNHWPRLLPFRFTPCTPPRLSSSHSLESSVSPGGDGSDGRCLGPHFYLA